MEGFSEIVLEMGDIVTVQGEEERSNVGVGENGERHDLYLIQKYSKLSPASQTSCLGSCLWIDKIKYKNKQN